MNSQPISIPEAKVVYKNDGIQAIVQGDCVILHNQLTGKVVEVTVKEWAEITSILLNR